MAEFLPAGASAAQWEILTGDAALNAGSTVFNPLSVSQPGNDYYTWAADVSAFNGYYQFRITTKCVVPVNGAGSDASLYAFTSPTLTGLIDFIPPTVYGSALPAAGTTWTPGAAISVTYDETISCSSLLFGVSAFAAPTAALLSAGQQLTAISVGGSCVGATVSIALTGSTNWTALSGAFMAVAVHGVTDVAGNSPAIEAPYSWSFPVASYDAQHSTVDLTGLAFFPNAATLLAQVQAARANYNSTIGSSHRRLLQVGGGSLPPTTQQVSLQSQLESEVVSAINLYMSISHLGSSGLTQQSVVVTALTPASVVASLTFQFTPKSSATGPSPITPITAASYFDQALQSVVMLPLLANCTNFPMLCQSVTVSNALNGTATAGGAQATQFALSAINVRPNTQVLAGVPAISAVNYATPTYTMEIDFALQSQSIAQLTFQLKLLSAYGTGYDQIQSLLLSYQVVPDPAADPDIIAETSYPPTILNSSVSTALSVANELQGQYYVALMSIPTQPGGLNYSITLTDWQRTSMPFFSQQLFVVGPPSPPTLLQVCQVSLQTIQLAYLPSQANGQTASPGNVNMTYQPTIGLYANGSTTALSASIPPAATSPSLTASWCMNNVTIPCSAGRCAPATLYMNVDLTQLPSLAAELTTAGSSQPWNFSLTAQNSIALTSSSASSYSGNPLTVYSVPAMVRPSMTLQVALNVLQLTFVLPASNGAPLTGWLVGWKWPNSTVHTDPAAGSTIVTPTPLPSGAAVNSTLNLTMPHLLLGPVAHPFYVFIQAINAYGPSPMHQHKVQPPAFVPPATALTVSPVVATTQSAVSSVYVTAANVTSQTQTVVVLFNAPLAANYSPSASMAMGFQIVVNETFPAANNSIALSTVSSFVTSNTTVTLSLPLFAVTNISVFALINSTNNKAKLCTPGAVSVIASQPAQSSLSSAAPVVPAQVSVTQNMAALVMSWPAGTATNGVAFRGWFAPASSDRDRTAFTSSNQILAASALKLTVPIPVSLTAANVTGTLLHYLVGLQAATSTGWGAVVWSDSTAAAGWTYPAWGEGLLAVPNAPTVANITQLTADTTTGVMSFSASASGLITPGSTLHYFFSPCSTAAGQLVITGTPSASVAVVVSSTTPTPLMSSSLPLAVQYCIVATVSNEAGSSTATVVPFQLSTASTLPGGSSAVNNALTGIYSVATMNLNQGAAAGATAIQGSLHIGTLGVSVALPVQTAPYTATPNSALIAGDNYMNALADQYLLTGNFSANSWLPSTFPTYLNVPGETITTSIVLAFTLQSAASAPYTSISTVQVSLQLLPDPTEDPDIVAETVYPLITLVSAASATLPAAQSATAAPGIAFLRSAAMDGSYLVWLTNIPSQAGGLQYALTVTDVTHGGLATTTAFINQTVFVAGAPNTPTIQAIAQTGPSTVVVTYDPSILSGLSWKSSIGVSYVMSIIDAVSGQVYAVPAAALSWPTSSGTSTGAVVSYSSSCYISATTMTLDVSAVPSLPMPAPGRSFVWEVSLSASTSLSQSAPSVYPLDMHAVPPSIPIPVVIPIALNQYRLSFAQPTLVDAVSGAVFPPVLGWLVGYTFSTTAKPTIDTVASTSVQAQNATGATSISSDIEYGGAAPAFTTLLTLPFPTASVPFWISVQAVNTVGPSAVRLHAFTPAFVSQPTISSVAQLQGADGDQSIQVTWTAPAVYQPSASLSAGYQLVHWPVGNSPAAVQQMATSIQTIVVAGLPLSNPNVSLSLVALVNSSNNAAKMCTTGAVPPLPSWPATKLFTLIQPASPPTVLTAVQTGLTTVRVTFSPTDNLSPSTGQSVITTYRVEYLTNTNVPAVNTSAAALLAFNAGSVVPTQTLSPAPYVSTTAVINTVSVTGLTTTAPGSTVPMVIGVTGFNIAGWGYASLVQLQNGLLGLPLPPIVTVTQTSAVQWGSSYTALVTVQFSFTGFTTQGYLLNYTLTPTGLTGVAPIVGSAVIGAPGLAYSQTYNVTVALGGSTWTVSAYTTNEVGQSAPVSQPTVVASVPLSPAPLTLTNNPTTQTVTVQFATPSAGGGSAVMQQYVLSWWSFNNSLTNSSSTKPLGTVTISAASTPGAINTYTLTAASLAGYAPGYATNYSFAVYSVSQYGNDQLAPSTGLVQVAVPNACCVRFGGAAAYPSFNVPTANTLWGVQATQITTGGLVTYNGAALPWYGNAWGNTNKASCVDWYQAFNQPRLTYFDTASGQWQSTFNLTNPQGGQNGFWQQTAAFQMLGAWSNNMYFTAWDLYTPVAASYLSGKVLRMPLQCNLGGKAGTINTCVEFTINSPQSQKQSLTWSPAQQQQCDTLLANN